MPRRAISRFESPRPPRTATIGRPCRPPWVSVSRRVRPSPSGSPGIVLRLVQEQHDGTSEALGLDRLADRRPRGASGPHRVEERRHGRRAGDAQPGNARNPAPTLGGRRLRRVERRAGNESGQQRLGQRDRRGQLPGLAVDRHRRAGIAVRSSCAPAPGKLAEQRGLARPRGAGDQPGTAPNGSAAHPRPGRRRVRCLR